MRMIRAPFSGNAPLLARTALRQCILRRVPLTRPKSTQNQPQQSKTTSKPVSVVSALAKDTLTNFLSRFRDLAIYNAGTFRTTFVGFTRLGTFIICLYSTFAIAPSLFFDPSTPKWWVPIVVVGSAVPIALVAVLGAPFVTNIRLGLPREARTVESIISYARSLPGDTKIAFQTFRWAPWPITTVMRFDELRRLPNSESRSANLAIQPAGASKAEQRKILDESPLTAWFAKRMYARLHVNRSHGQDRSSAPGVLDIIWEQIPFLVGEEHATTRQAKTPMVSKVQTIKTTVKQPARRHTRAPPKPSKYTR